MKKAIMITILFATAMGLLEAAVVVYLRIIYYPSGFSFPLVPIDNRTALVEVAREAATIIMLGCWGWAAGRDKLRRWAHFVLAFAIWDLVYYLCLYVFLAWPASLNEWDILFLIPYPWVGPVWSPCLICLLLIAFAVRAVALPAGYRVRTTNVLLAVAGAVTCIVAFMWDYITLVLLNPLTRQQGALFSDLSSYVPHSFNHGLYFTGLAVLATGLFLITKSKNHE